MKKTQFILGLIFWINSAWAANSACLPSLTGFVCKDSNEKIVLNRCATNRGDYDLVENNQKLRCHLVTSTSDDAKNSFIILVKASSQRNLEKFKQACNFSSPIDFDGDKDIRDSVQDIMRSGEIHSIRALIYSESHCVNINSHETVLSWLGNEILIAHPSNLIQAFGSEEKNMHLKEIAQMETNEWRKFKCKTDACRLNRNTHFASKLTALQNAKVPSKYEPLRQEILQSLQSVTNAGKQSFLTLAKTSSDINLSTFKEECTISNPVDFTYDDEVHQEVAKLFANGNMNVIRALIYAEPHCTDIQNRKNILRWLGNEILLSHPDKLIHALEYEDKKHELYDIAEIENITWSETKCSGDPCSSNRKDYFASKRKALTEAKISRSQEPIRRMLLKGLVSDL